MDLERQRKFRKLSFRLSKAFYYLMSIVFIYLGFYFIYLPLDLSRLDNRIIYYVSTLFQGMFLFLAFVICIFVDYEEK
jgi:hypothetical protein